MVRIGEELKARIHLFFAGVAILYHFREKTKNFFSGIFRGRAGKTLTLFIYSVNVPLSKRHYDESSIYPKNIACGFVFTALSQKQTYRMDFE